MSIDRETAVFSCLCSAHGGRTRRVTDRKIRLDDRVRKFTSFLWLCVAIDHRGPRAPRLLAVVRGPRCRIPREHPRSPPRDRSFASPRRTMDPSMLTPEMMAFAQKQMANMTPEQMVRVARRDPRSRRDREPRSRAEIYACRDVAEALGCISALSIRRGTSSTTTCTTSARARMVTRTLSSATWKC